MTNSGKPAASGSAARTGMTGQEIVAMYRDDFGLAVCDDADRIRREVQNRQQRHVKSKQRNPDPRTRAKADEWFKNAALLQDAKQRAKLLRIVYEDWAGQADLSLMAHRHSGIKSLTAPLIGQLQTIAVQGCNLTEELARRFVRDYMSERGLEEEGELFPLQPVQPFDAVGRLGSIELSWKLPPACSQVQITRSEGLPAAAAGPSRVVYRGGGEKWEDADVESGKSYVYTICPLDKDGTPGPATSRSNVLCLGEVKNAQAAWTGQAVRLGWTPPTSEATVVILRRIGGRPAVTAGTHGWLPADAATAEVATLKGGTTAWEDHDVAEGRTYHYLIVADFGLGRVSQGVTCRVSIPKRPQPVASLRADFKQDADGICVELEWTRVKEKTRTVRYVVLRRAGSVAPTTPEGQEIVTVTAQTRCIDRDVEPGKRYTYAVFSQVGEVSSVTGTAAPPVDVLADVSDPRVTIGDGTVELSWATPASAQVVVRRSLSPPADSTDGEPVALSANHRACDQGLHNGRLYHYLICCVYRPDGVTERVSGGVRVQAVPEPLPDPIDSLQVEPRGSEVVCSFSPPDHGHALVLRSAARLQFDLGRRLPSSELERLGDRLSLSGPGQVVDGHPDVNKPWYTAVTVAGDHAVVGQGKSCVVFPDVTDLRLSASQEGVVARWVWPAGCTAVVIARREDDWPSEPGDPQAMCATVSQMAYHNAGDRFVDALGQGEARFHYVVFAKAPAAGGEFYAPGTSSGCRAVLHWRRWTELRYRLVAPEKNRLRLEWSVEDPAEVSDFAGFILRADEEWVPAGRGDGIELFRWVPRKGRATGTYQATVPLKAVRAKRWRRFYCKLMTLDPAQEPTTLIIHPDTCVSSREIFASRRKPKPNKPLSTRAPKKVICPYCFDTFPVGSMLFGSYERNEDPLPARHTWRDRLFGRPPRPPVAGLARKLCPKNKHDLPWSAALQKSLFVGLIGAASSGKSHYVAALVDRLQGQVGGDLSAAMIHCTDETPRRYEREFYNPLFGNHQELPKTVASPPPLVYDLTFDGGLWDDSRNRAVTLTLYDTAGENFNDPATVRQMLRYLRVASGVVFLVDPLQIPEVREIVPASVPLPPLDGRAQPSRIIGNVLQMLEDGKVLTENTKLDVPVAVVLTKCDVLRDAGLIDLNRLWNVDRRHIDGFDREIHEDVTGMMGEWMYRWCSSAYTTVARRFARYAFFGVSATGCAPDKRTRRYRFVSPWRVEDPLIWLLAELGVIPMR